MLMIYTTRVWMLLVLYVISTEQHYEVSRTAEYQTESPIVYNTSDPTENRTKESPIYSSFDSLTHSVEDPKLHRSNISSVNNTEPFNVQRNPRQHKTGHLQKHSTMRPPETHSTITYNTVDNKGENGIQDLSVPCTEEEKARKESIDHHIKEPSSLDLSNLPKYLKRRNHTVKITPRKRRKKIPVAGRQYTGIYVIPDVLCSLCARQPEKRGRRQRCKKMFCYK